MGKDVAKNGHCNEQGTVSGEPCFIQCVRVGFSMNFIVAQNFHQAVMSVRKVDYRVALQTVMVPIVVHASAYGVGIHCTSTAPAASSWSLSILSAILSLYNNCPSILYHHLKNHCEDTKLFWDKTRKCKKL